MNKSEQKRRSIFDKFSQQLNDIVTEGLIEVELPYEKTYICPICLQQFSENDLNTDLKNHLTLEDAPPFSLGGKANTLTCKKCNNESGYKIDFHLVEILNEHEIRNFLPNTTAKVNMTHKGQKVQGILEIDNEGGMTITHLIKYNNPSTLKSYVNNTRSGDKPILYFQASRVDVKKVEVALLKSAYILAFEHYGYSLILCKSFDIVREQILKPDEEIYPNGFWTKQKSFDESNVGVHFITSKSFEGLMSIFMLETKSGQRNGYGVYLPISIHTYKEVIEKLKGIEPQTKLNFESYKNTDFFGNLTNQKLCVNYMKNRNK